MKMNGWLSAVIDVGKVGAKDHHRFQASYATILKAHMTAWRRGEEGQEKAAGSNKQESASKKPKKAWNYIEASI